MAIVVKQRPATFRGWQYEAGNGIIKLIAEQKTGALLGATAAGPHGAELLGLLSLAVHAHVKIAKLRSMIYAFPTFYGGVGDAVGAYGRGLSTVLDPTYHGFELLDALGMVEED